MRYNLSQLENELELLNQIAGLEVRLNPTTPLWKETFRRMDGLYHELCIARLYLLMAAKGQYPEFVSEENNEQGNKMFQYTLVNSSILWYNNCFDILLQVVWTFYEMWTLNSKINISNTPSDWTLEQIEEMKKKCDYNKIDKWNTQNEKKVESIINLHETDACSRVRNWANEIKHRSPLFVRGVSTSSPIRYAYFNDIKKSINDDGKVSLSISISADKYDSKKVVQEYDVDELISTLINYHKELCNCIEDVTSNFRIKQKK